MKRGVFETWDWRFFLFAYFGAGALHCIVNGALWSLSIALRDI